MPKVTIQPLDKTIEVDSDKNLLEALREEGIYIKSSCGGHASCSDCVIKIVEGKDNINTPSFEETSLLGNVFHITKERMSCQTLALGDITIDVSMHDKNADEKSIRNKTSAKKMTRVKKKDQVDKEREEREQAEQTQKEEDANWHKHWERDKEEGPKRLGGARRPKPFRTDNIDYDEKPFDPKAEKKFEKKFDKKFDKKSDNKKDFKKSDKKDFKKSDRKFDRKDDQKKRGSFRKKK